MSRVTKRRPAQPAANPNPARCFARLLRNSPIGTLCSQEESWKPCAPAIRGKSGRSFLVFFRFVIRSLEIAERPLSIVFDQFCSYSVFIHQLSQEPAPLYFYFTILYLWEADLYQNRPLSFRRLCWPARPASNSHSCWELNSTPVRPIVMSGSASLPVPCQRFIRTILHSMLHIHYRASRFGCGHHVSMEVNVLSLLHQH